jgi:hypothetical protein
VPVLRAPTSPSPGREAGRVRRPLRPANDLLQEPYGTVSGRADYQQALSNLSNPELLSALDLALLELEKRLFRYAKVGPELLEMADEGLVLAARAKARLGQSLSAAQHTDGHLQVVGVGEWRPTSTRPAWNAEPRLPGSEEGS